MVNFSMPVMPGFHQSFPSPRFTSQFPLQVPTSNTFLRAGCSHSTGWGRTYFMIWPSETGGCCTTKYLIIFLYFCKVWPTTKVLNFEKACKVAKLHSNCGHFLLAGGSAPFVSGHMFLAVRMDYHLRVSLQFAWTLTRPQIGNYYSS